MESLKGTWYQQMLCCVYANVLPLIEGQTGIAKSQIALQICDIIKKPCYYLNGGRATDADVEMVIPQGGLDAIKYRMAANEVFHECYNHFKKTGEWSVVLIDEATDMVGLTQLAFQGLVTERKLEGGKLDIRDAVRFVMIGNPPEISTSGNQLSIPMVTRVVKIEAPVDGPATIAYLRAGRRGSAVLAAFPEPAKDDVEHELNKLDQSLAAYLERNDSTKLLTIPEKVEERMRPWPNPRTISYMNEVLAVARVVGMPEEALITLAAGAVGRAFATAYLSYFKDLDIPDPLPMLRGTTAIVIPTRADQLTAFSYSFAEIGRRVISKALDEGKTKEAKQLWARASEMIKAIANEAPDVATNVCPALIELQSRNADKLDLNDTVDRLLPAMRLAGRLSGRS